MAEVTWSEDDLGYVARVGRRPLERLLADLPAEQRQAVQAHVVEEVGYRDLARIAGVSQSAMRQRVSRGLAALRRQLTKEPR
jgi:RNA polymerase sigma-70 factor (ECF subfamily)